MVHIHIEVVEPLLINESKQRTYKSRFITEMKQDHPAGDVTRVSVMPRKVTVKIGGAENRCRGYLDKNR